MKPNIIHSIVVCLAACILPILAACSSHEAPVPDTQEATLYLNIAPLGQTRAGSLTDNEKMQSLRVIVLHEDGTVEHNNMYSLSGSEDSKSILLKVTPNEKKKIFLFANEMSVTEVEGVNVTEDKSLTAFFNSYQIDVSDFAEKVNELYFAPDYSSGKAIPMSSMYEVDAMPQGGYETRTFYVVRVATKFTVNFENWRDEDVKVTSFSIASHADKNFLMAHVNSYPNPDNKYPTWIDWLKAVSDASSENDSYATTKAAGWLKDYNMPSVETNNNTYEKNGINVGAWDTDNKTPSTYQTVFYLPESKNNPDATDGTQKYTMTINIDGRQEPFMFQLPNLEALFRSTHVVINIVIKDNDVELKVDLFPYTSIILEPTFGLDYKEN